MKLLVTGGAGFIGSNFIRCMHTRHPHYALTNFDALTYAGNLENLSDIPASSTCRFVRGDIR
ncbi:MAG: NAD-dependent epimerase/dehydratase family protein, partial [Deltaproteobacteria bacterium]|nr:NAD-dependent epimerase/dehydratase family protein [Deltaproteobacteria bacterium]